MLLFLVRLLIAARQAVALRRDVELIRRDAGNEGAYHKGIIVLEDIQRQGARSVLAAEEAERSHKAFIKKSVECVLKHQTTRRLPSIDRCCHSSLPDVRLLVGRPHQDTVYEHTRRTGLVNDSPSTVSYSAGKRVAH
jgi:hypothetical protein